jgi:hypothetical protein
VQLAIARNEYAVVDLGSGEVHEFSEVAERLPWRNNSLAPHEPRMPPHQYLLVRDLRNAQLEACHMLEFTIDRHPEAYLAYFRGYQHPTRYLEVRGFRYWRSRLQGRWFLNRARLDSCEPPRRVSEGARPIPPEQWRAKYPWWPQGSGYGEWRRERGEWVFHPEDQPPETQTLFDVDSVRAES